MGHFYYPLIGYGGELFKAGIEGKYRHILIMLLGLVVSISIIVLPNNISAVIRALNTHEDNRTGQDVPHFQVGENPYKIAIDISDIYSLCSKQTF